MKKLVDILLTFAGVLSLVFLLGAAWSLGVRAAGGNCEVIVNVDQ